MDFYFDCTVAYEFTKKTQMFCYKILLINLQQIYENKIETRKHKEYSKHAPKFRDIIAVRI